jgi:hypothetical protein
MKDGDALLHSDDERFFQMEVRDRAQSIPARFR